MITLYRNYTVVVQTSTSPYAPNNSLRLFLYEGRVEMKKNASTGLQAVFNYGTTLLATSVYNKDGIAAEALVADSINRPGEYDFLSINLNKANSLSYLGQTLYSVVARPMGDTDFENARVIVDSTDISDPNTKQIVRSATGGTTTIVDNLFLAGGTVTFEQYTPSVGTPSETEQWLSLLNLPDVLVNMFETGETAPAWADPAGTKLTSRFDVHYSDTIAGTDSLIWEAVPAFKTSDDKWVIRLTNDQYSTFRSKELGVVIGSQINLAGIYPQLLINVNLQQNNVYIRRFDNFNTGSPSLPLAYTALDKKERPIIHSFIDGSDNMLVGIGAWQYTSGAETPAYNLDVKGGLGLRQVCGNYTQIRTTPTSARFGFDTEAYFQESHILFEPYFCHLYTNSELKFKAQSGAVLLGVDVNTEPYFKALSNDVQMVGSANTYLKVSNAETIQAYVDVSGSSYQMIDLTPSVSNFGFSVASTGTSRIGFTLTTGLIKVGGAEKIDFQPTYIFMGQNISGDPIIHCTTGFVRLRSSAYTYIETNTTGDRANIFYNVVGVATQAFTAGSSGGVIIGQDSTAEGHIVFSGSTVNHRYAGTTKLQYNSTSITFGHSIVAYPRMSFTSSFMGLWGSVETYFEFANTPAAKGSIIGYQGHAVGDSRKWLSVNETAGEVIIGSDISSVGNLRFSTNGTQVDLRYSTTSRVQVTASSLLLGYSTAAYPRISAAAAALHIYGGANTYIKFDSTGTGSISGALDVGGSPIDWLKVNVVAGEVTIGYNPSTACYTTYTSTLGISYAGLTRKVVFGIAASTSMIGYDCSGTTPYYYFAGGAGFVGLFAQDSVSSPRVNVNVIGGRIEIYTDNPITTPLVIGDTTPLLITDNENAGYGHDAGTENRRYWKVPWSTDTGDPDGDAPNGAMFAADTLASGNVLWVKTPDGWEKTTLS